MQQSGTDACAARVTYKYGINHRPALSKAALMLALYESHTSMGLII